MPDKLRIAMLSAHSCPVGTLGARDTGGMSVYIRELACELDKLGHQVDVFTRVHDPDDPAIIPLGENARLVHLAAGEVETVSKLDIFPHLPAFAAELENFRCRSGIEYDAVYSHYWLSGLAGRHLAGRWMVPHLIMFHTLGSMKNAVGIGERELALRLSQEKSLAQDCSRIVAPTQREKDNLVRYCAAPESRISVVPCGVNLELFHPLSGDEIKLRHGREDEKVLLFVGRFDPLKGIELLLESVALLAELHKIRLVLVGGDSDREKDIDRLKSMAEALGIGGYIDFMGPVKQEALPGYYSAADVCVVPSYYESFGMVPLESLACGTPVVTTDIGNVREIIMEGLTGTISSPSPESLAEKIAYFLSRPRPDASLMRASIEGYGWDKVAGQVVSEFHSAIRERSAAPA